MKLNAGFVLCAFSRSALAMEGSFMQDRSQDLDPHIKALRYLDNVFGGTDGYAERALEKLKGARYDLGKKMLTELERVHRVVNTNNETLRQWPGLKDVQLDTNKYLFRAFEAITKANGNKRLMEKIKNYICQKYIKIRTFLGDKKKQQEMDIKLNAEDEGNLDDRGPGYDSDAGSALSRSSSVGSGAAGIVSSPPPSVASIIGSDQSDPSVASDRSGQVYRAPEGEVEEKTREADHGNVSDSVDAHTEEKTEADVHNVIAADDSQAEDPEPVRADEYYMVRDDEYVKDNCDMEAPEFKEAAFDNEPMHWSECFMEWSDKYVAENYDSDEQYFDASSDYFAQEYASWDCEFQWFDTPNQQYYAEKKVFREHLIKCHMNIQAFMTKQPQEKVTQKAKPSSAADKFAKQLRRMSKFAKRRGSTTLDMMKACAKKGQLRKATRAKRSNLPAVSEAGDACNTLKNEKLGCARLELPTVEDDFLEGIIDHDLDKGSKFLTENETTEEFIERMLQGI